MFVRSIYLRGREAPIILQYRTAQHVGDDNNTAPIDGGICYSDDFGRSFFCSPHDIIGELITDVAREHEANGKLALMHAREQAKLNTRASADPALKFAAAGRPGLIG